MKRLTCRAAGAIVGIALGWYVAGVVFTGQPSVAPGLGANYAHASDADHDSHGEHAPAAEDSHGTHDVHDEHGDHDQHGADAGHDAALTAAGQLVPQSQDIPWFRPVLYVAAGLFVAAIVLGIPALKLRGPEPADAAADHSSSSHH